MAVANTMVYYDATNFYSTGSRVERLCASRCHSSLILGAQFGTQLWVDLSLDAKY